MFMTDNSRSIVRVASAVLLSVLVWPIATSAKDVTLALTTVEEGQSVALESRQQLWKSTYGGWIVTGWPYSMSVDQTPVYLFQTIDERLATKLESDTKKANGGLDDVLNEIKGQPDKVQASDLMASRSERRSTITLDLAPGRHVLKPFNIEFTLGPDGLLASKDSRVRVDAKRDRIEIVCHPVSIKLFSHGQSTHGPIRVTCGATSLLAGLEKQIAEFEKQNAGVLGAADGKGLRRVTLYLPASNPAAPYEVNSVPFELDPAGSVRVTQTDLASATGREIQLLVNNTIEVPRPLGVRWFGASIKTTMSSGEKTVEVNGSGSDWLPVPSARSIKLGSETVPLPVADTRWPHELVIWNVAESAAWSVAAASLAGSPGGEWTCRILPLTKTTPAAPAMLSVRLEPEPRAELGGPLGGQLGGELRLHSQGNGVYTGQLPEKTGLWRLTVHEPKQGARPKALEGGKSRSVEQLQGRCETVRWAASIRLGRVSRSVGCESPTNRQLCRCRCTQTRIAVSFAEAIRSPCDGPRNAPSSHPPAKVQPALRAPSLRLQSLGLPALGLRGRKPRLDKS
jgi:hypothetical protein